MVLSLDRAVGKMRLWIVLGASLAILTGCKLFERDPGIDSEVRSVFEQIRHHDDGALRLRLSSELVTPAALAQLAVVERMAPANEPSDRVQVGTNTFTNPTGVTITATDEYHYPDGAALVTTQIHKASGAKVWQVTGFNLRRATNSELASNNFTFVRKGMGQLAFLAALCAFFMLMIAALVKVVRTPGLKRKWLWGIAAFLGVFTLTMNWATGEFGYVLAIQWMGTGVTRAATAFAPWMLQTTLPVGAILILTGVWANPARARKPKPPKPAPISETVGEPKRPADSGT